MNPHGEAYRQADGTPRPLIVGEGWRLAHPYREKRMPTGDGRWQSDIDGKQIIDTIGHEVTT
jgi:hypothetical protein